MARVRIGVMGDTHGQIKTAQKVLREMGAIDYLLHTGDFYGDAGTLAATAGLMVPVHAVRGNCDGGGEGPLEVIIEIAGKKIYLTHGHSYQAHVSYQRLLYRGLELQADVVVFGHTHRQECSEHEGLLLFNPGSIALPYHGNKPQYGIIIIKDGKIEAQLQTMVNG